MLNRSHFIFQSAPGIALLLFLCIPAQTTAQYTSAQKQYDKAVEYFQDNRFDRAMEHLNELLPVVCSPEEIRDLCFDGKLIEILITRRQNNFAQADKLLGEILNIVHDSFGGDKSKLVQIYAHRIFLADEMSDMKEADYWGEKISMFTNDEDADPLTRARAFISGGYYEDMKGDYKQAADYFTKGIDLTHSIEKTDDIKKLVIQARNNLGVSYRRMGKPDKAMAEYQASLKLTRDLYGEEHLEISTAYNNIGTIYYQLQDIGLAAEFFSRAASIIESNLGPENRRAGAALNNAGLCYYALKKYDRAAKFLERAQRVKESTLGLNHLETAIGYSNLASIHIQNEDYQSAKENYLQSISVRENIYELNHPSLVDPHLQLGKLYTRNLDQHQKARQHYETALQIGLDRLGEVHPAVADSYFLIGESYLNEELHDEALSHFSRAAELLYVDFSLDETFDSEQPITDPVKFVKVLHYIAKAHHEKSDNFDQDRYQTAFQAIEWACELIDIMQKSYQHEASKLRLVDHYYSIYTDAVEILAKLYEHSGDEIYKDQIFEYIEKSRARVALELMQDLSARSFGGVPKDVTDRDALLNSNITKLQQKIYQEQQKGLESNSDSIYSLQDSLFRKKRELEQFTYELEDTYPSYYQLKYDQSVISRRDVASLLTDDETILSYVIGQEKIYAIVLDKTDMNIISLGSAGGLKDEIKEFKNTVIRKQGTTRYKELAYSLYQKLVEPIRDYIDTESVFIMPDQVLHYLPFEMLLTSAVNHDNYQHMPYLLKELTISYIPSATMLNAMLEKRPENPKHLLAVAPFNKNNKGFTTQAAEINFTGPDRPLLLTGYETRSISKIFRERRELSEYIWPHKTKLLLGAEATKKQVHNTSLQNYNFIHFATHAFINESTPDQSGIMLYPEDDEDGIAYVSDIYNMELNADLVVLGACDTGMGSIYKGEGLIGFTRAFIYAGASNLAVSMWRVNDQATAYLMIDFYNFIRQGYSYSKALQKAKISMVEQPQWSDPANWAAFVLNGR